MKVKSLSNVSVSDVFNLHLYIVAETRDIALAATRAVLVRYEELPAILDIDDAIEANSFHNFEPIFTVRRCRLNTSG